MTSHRYTKKQERRILRLAALMIAPFEGFSAKPYQDTAHVWTIGYGHIENVTSGGLRLDGVWHTKISRLFAVRLLADDLRKTYWPAVRDFPVKLNIFQAIATVSFIYNCGVGMLQESHDFGRLLRAKRFHAAADSLLEYVNDIAHHHLAGLVRRRKAERALFLRHVVRTVVHTTVGRVTPKGRKRGTAGIPPRKQDIKAFQRAWNHFIHDCDVPMHKLAIDGMRGPATKATEASARYFLGNARKYVHEGISQTLIRQLYHPSLAGPRALARGLDRRRAIRARHAKHDIDISTAGVHELARYILDSPHVHFWTGLSTGSDRQRFVELARKGEAYCSHTGQWVKPGHTGLMILRFIAAQAKAGRDITVNALTGGVHSVDSRHYGFRALDTGLSTGGSEEQVEAAHYGLIRNNETDHRHYSDDGH